MDMTRDYPLCVGLVGVGYWGPNLLRTLMNNPEVRLKTVVDVSTERREYVISLHPNIQVVDKLDILLVLIYIIYILRESFIKIPDIT